MSLTKKFSVVIPARPNFITVGEQKLSIALKVSSRVCVMGHGRIVFEGSPGELKSNEKLMTDWLAV